MHYIHDILARLAVVIRIYRYVSAVCCARKVSWESRSIFDNTCYDCRLRAGCTWIARSNFGASTFRTFNDSTHDYSEDVAGNF